MLLQELRSTQHNLCTIPAANFNQYIVTLSVNMLLSIFYKPKR